MPKKPLVGYLETIVKRFQKRQLKTTLATSAAISELGSLIVRWSKKHLSAWSPSLLGITVYKDVMSIVKISLFLPEKKKKSRKKFQCAVTVFDERW